MANMKEIIVDGILELSHASTKCISFNQFKELIYNNNLLEPIDNENRELFEYWSSKVFPNYRNKMPELFKHERIENIYNYQNFFGKDLIFIKYLELKNKSSNDVYKYALELLIFVTDLRTNRLKKLKRKSKKTKNKLYCAVKTEKEKYGCRK